MDMGRSWRPRSNGHELREELLEYMSLDEAGDSRGRSVHGPMDEIGPDAMVRLRSRFETDLNRPREKAVYPPEDAWGLKVWKDTLRRRRQSFIG